MDEHNESRDPESEPPTDTEPSEPVEEGEEAEAPPKRIWDPKTGSWVSPDELEPSPVRSAMPPWERGPARPSAPEAGATSNPEAEAARPPTQETEAEPEPEPGPDSTAELARVEAEAEPATEPVTEPVPSAVPVRPAVPVGLTILVAAVTGAVLSVAAMLFVPGFVDRDPGPATSSAGRGQTLEAATAAAEAGDSVVTVAVTTEGDDRYGSGFAIDTGIIVTAQALVDEATEVRVRGRFGAYVSAEVVGQDQASGVALLRAELPDVEPAVLASSELLHPGDRVTVVGALPGAQTFLATAAVASIGRPVQSGEIVRFNQIQLDNSGPLVPAGGIVVDRTLGAIGLAGSSTESGGAQVVPIEVVRSVATQLQEGAEVEHPWVGVVTDFVEIGGQDAARGLVVSLVVRGSPAQTSEVAQGDVIVAVDGHEIEGPGTMLIRTLGHRVGEQMQVTVLRDGESIDLELRVANQPSRV